MIPRRDYTDKKVSFEDYYGQFDVNGVLGSILSRYLINRILASEDHEAFNDVPLRMWDTLPHPTNVAQMISEANGGKPGYTWASPSDWVCAYKVAARKLRAAAPRK